MTARIEFIFIPMYECKSKREREMVCSLAQFSPGAGGVLRPGYFCCLHVRHWWLLVSEILFSALIRRGAVGRRLSCGRGWQRLSRSLPHLMYNYTDGETQVCLLSAIETLFTETCAHLHCCSIFVCLFILSSLGSALEFTSKWISVVLRSYFPVK